MTKKNKNFSILALSMEDILTKKTYIIGTRGSLLALTQCGQIKDQLESLTGDSFELKIIKTQGDQITDKPLWQLEGKDFFTKELDEALISGDVDLVVHSYKDLGTIRPTPITLAAITKRDFANDILLIKNSTIQNLSNLDEIIVGTSSPRRIVNLENSLHEFLPNQNKKLNIKTKILRGNVNSRIAKLQDDGYHAIVLAMPGIERLAITESSRMELSKLIEGLNFMILPSSDFPAAASQGALGIECLLERKDDGELLAKLKKLEDKITVLEISRERQAFASYGGGCHLAVGINVQKVGDFYVHTHKGSVDDKVINERRLEGSFASPEQGVKKINAFLGMPKNKLPKEDSLELLGCELITKKELCASIDSNSNIFISSDYAFNSLINFSNPTPKRLVFSAGATTWKKAASKGIWIHASADSLGEENIKKVLNSHFIKLISEGSANKVSVLTNKKSKSLLGEIVEVYEKEYLKASAEYEQRLFACNVFYWTSFDQYEYYTQTYPQLKTAFHCCGLGKTFEQFRKHSINVRPFCSTNEFNTWLKK